MISVSLGYFSLISLNTVVPRTIVFLEAESYIDFFLNQTLLPENKILDLPYSIAALPITSSKLYWQNEERLRFGFLY